ncbi:MAG: hypothetical protein KC620_04625, partial [Myxococcales bacterium]|nr:hypothetical protein [Myxococcales bacterium]
MIPPETRQQRSASAERGQPPRAAQWRADRRLLARLRPHAGAALRLAAWSWVLAWCTAGYGALAGPALRALFGGEALRWPAWIAGSLPPPPDLTTLRSVLPAVILGVALLKGLAFHRYTVGLAALGQRFVAALRRDLHARLLVLPPDAAAAIGAGDLLSRCVH